MNYKCGGKRSATPLWLPRQPGLDKPKRRRRYALPAHSITAPTWQDFGVRCANAVRGGLSQRDRAGVRGKDTHDSERGSGQFHADPEPGSGSGSLGHGTLLPKQRERLLQSRSLLILTLPLILYPSVTPQLNHPSRVFAMGCSPHIGLARPRGTSLYLKRGKMGASGEESPPENGLSFALEKP